METKRQTVEYKFLRQNIQHHTIPRNRLSIAIYLSLFHVAFIILYGFFIGYKYEDGATDNLSKRLASLISVNSMIFIGLGFLMSFLQKYAYSAIGFSFLIGAYVLEWALLIRGWLILLFSHNYSGTFAINIDNILAADFCCLAVLISFAAIVGRASLSQLVVMATIEVVVQCLNELIGKNLLMAHDVGQAMYVHAFGAFFGLAVSKILHHKDIETRKESSYYFSDVFAMLGALFVWINWPSFNSINASGDGQFRAVINTFLAMLASCVSTFTISILLGRGRINMCQVQAATFAGGIVVGSICDLPIQPYGALICGTIAGIISTICLEYLTPFLRNCYLHDTCGVNSTFGISGVVSGLIASLVALTSNAPDAFRSLSSHKFNMGNLSSLNNLNSLAEKIAPALALNATSNVTLPYSESSDIILNSTIFNATDIGRSAAQQAGFQLAGLLVTISIAIISGILTGLIMKIPIFEQLTDDDDMFDDELNWFTPEDFTHDMTEVRIKSVEEQELTKITELN